MSQAEVLITGLLIAVAVLSVLSRWLPVPYPLIQAAQPQPEAG